MMSLQIQTVLQADAVYSRYRIPGIVTTARNTLLLYFEARRTADDWADMDILLFRSDDGGETFSAPIVMAEGTKEHPTVNNPVCFAGKDGILHFLYCRSYTVSGGDLFYRRSEDDGRTWSQPQNIMEATRPELHNVFACGPGHGICTQDGRLLVPVWMVLKRAGAPLRQHGPAVVSTLVSADSGHSWKLGDLILPTDGCPDPNETQAAETSDGGIYLNLRCTGAKCRAASWGRTGLGGWSPLVRVEEMPDPTCFGSVISADTKDGRHVLLAVNCAHTERRENLVCRASEDDGHTWPYALTVEPGEAGYADLTVLADHTVCVLYEQGGGICDRLARFPLSDLL